MLGLRGTSNLRNCQKIYAKFWVEIDWIFLLAPFDVKDEDVIGNPNEALRLLKDEPLCGACNEYHEAETQAQCFGMYLGEGGFVGNVGDGIMPECDPTSLGAPTREHHRRY
jgi:hypothetical protein